MQWWLFERKSASPEAQDIASVAHNITENQNRFLSARLNRFARRLFPLSPSLSDFISVIWRMDRWDKNERKGSISIILISIYILFICRLTRINIKIIIARRQRCYEKSVEWMIYAPVSICFLLYIFFFCFCSWCKYWKRTRNILKI